MDNQDRIHGRSLLQHLRIMLLSDQDGQGYAMESVLKEWGRNAPPPSHTMMFLMEVLSSWFPLLAKLCVIFLFALVLPFKLQGFIVASWYWICAPLYVFAIINLAETLAFFGIWTYWRVYKREIDYFQSFRKSHHLILWINDPNPRKFTPLFGRFSYTMGNSHSSDCLRPCCCRAFFQIQNPFIKATQVLSGVAFCFLLPCALMNPGNTGISKVVSFLWLWYVSFLGWGMYEKVLRSYHQCESESYIAQSGIFAICLSLGLLSLTIWIFLWAFSYPAQDYCFGAIPLMLAATCLFCFPFWLFANRRDIQTHPDYYPPMPMDDPGDFGECISASVMCIIFQPSLILSGLFFTWKITGEESRSWLVVFIPLWVGLILIWVGYAMHVKYDAGYDFARISLKDYTQHLQDPAANDIWKKEVFLGTVRRILARSTLPVERHNIKTIFEMMGWFQGAHRFDRSPLLLEAVSDDSGEI
eukprot:TRINITY_DN9730_c0_g2_i1.p1 TRINITY_DN9730_c0_g2~~TRINITY_DN9730_c0_g2_i1.p1  ORF type:complete len:471 (-),score=67.83 TRINITY_DN9730_c0_g2_i1:226-1638(-)